LFVVVVIYFNAALVNFKVDHQWILNIIDDCHNDDSYEYRMGIDFTFEDTAVIFSIFGAGCGAPNATMTIENILWSETSFIKRNMRGLIGAAVIISTFLLLNLIPHEDYPIKYFFNNLLPHLLDHAYLPKYFSFTKNEQWFYECRSDSGGIQRFEMFMCFMKSF
jgi:hypothetical protein